MMFFPDEVSLKPKAQIKQMAFDHLFLSVDLLWVIIKPSLGREQ
jgi:hypothetical protein